MTAVRRADLSAPRTAGPRRAPFVAAGGVGLALVADVAFDPAHHHVPLCPFHAATGAWCPLCGGLRAGSALAHGQWSAAFHDNALFLASLPLLAALWLDWVLRSRNGGTARRLSGAVVAAVIVLALAFGVIRNLPFAGALRPV